MEFDIKLPSTAVGFTYRVSACSSHRMNSIRHTYKNINFLFHFPCLACVKFEFHHQQNVLEARTAHTCFKQKSRPTLVGNISFATVVYQQQSIVRFGMWRYESIFVENTQNVVEALKLPVIVATTSVCTQTRAARTQSCMTFPIHVRRICELL